MEPNPINKPKPVVVYFHRYPIEFEAGQFPATTALLTLLARKYEVVYFSMAGVQRDESLRAGIRCEELSLKIDRANTGDKWSKTLLYYFYLPHTLLRLKKLNPAFIICKETLPLIPSLVLRLRRPALIDISDWWLSIQFGKSAWGKKFAGFVEKLEVTDWNRFPVMAVTHTRAETALMEKKGMARDKIQIINAPQHEGVYYPIAVPGERKKLGLREDDWVVAVHGIIHPSKGYDQIIEWWAQLIQSRPNWKLVIIGGSGVEVECRQKITALKLEANVLMTGWLPDHADVNRALNAADCLLVTRRNSPENQGVIPSSLYHSLALCKPTVVTGLPGMSEVVTDKVNGFVYQPDRYESFRSTLEYVCDREAEAATAAEQGVLTAKERFDLNACARKYFELIDRMALS